MIKALQKTRSALRNAWRSFKSTFSLVSSGFRFKGRGAARFGSASFDALVSLARENATARRAIMFIAQNLASIPLHAARVDSEGEMERLPDHPVLDLLDNPAGMDNYRYGRRWVIDTMVWGLMGGGDYFQRVISPSGGPNQGVPRRIRTYDHSDFAGFIRDPGSNLVTGYHLSDYNNRLIQGDLQEILHAYYRDPLDRDYGLPILLSIQRQLELIENTDEWNLNVAESQGEVPGFFKPVGLEPGDQLPQEQVDQGQDQLDEKVNNARERNRWLLLGGAYEPMSNAISPKDAEWLEGSKYYSRLVATGLGIDPVLLGDGEAKTYNNYSTALVIAFTTTILPMLDFMLDHWNRWLLPKFGDDDVVLMYDRGEIAALDEQLLQRVEALAQAVQGSILTPDEARQEMNRDTIGADELLVPFNVQTNSMLFGGSPAAMGGDPAAMRALASMSPDEAKKHIDDILSEAPSLSVSGDGR